MKSVEAMTNKEELRRSGTSPFERWDQTSKRMFEAFTKGDSMRYDPTSSIDSGPVFSDTTAEQNPVAFLQHAHHACRRLALRLMEVEFRTFSGACIPAKSPSASRFEIVHSYHCQDSVVSSPFNGSCLGDGSP